MFEWPNGPVIVSEELLNAQQGFSILEHFIGSPPDSNKSNSALGFVEVSSGGGGADVAWGTQVAGGWGQSRLELPARAVPVAPDGAAIRGVVTAGTPFPANGIIGRLGFSVRVNLSNVPQVGSDYLAYFGIADAEANQAQPSDGLYFYTDLGNANWLCRHRRAGASTDIDTGLAKTSAAWVTLGAILDVTEGLVEAFVASDGDALESVGTVAPANVQPAADIKHICGIHNPGNITLAAAANVDYFQLAANYGVFR